MAVTSISVILTVFVLKLHHGKPHQREIPRWVRVLVLKYIARFVNSSCVSASNYDHQDKRLRSGKNTKKLANENTDICLRLINDGIHLNSFRRTHMNHGRPNSLIQTDSLLDVSNLDSSEQRRLGILDEILKYLKILVARRDEDDRESDILKEWQQVAVVMDRFLFFCFLTIILLTTCVNLIIYPVFYS